MALNLMKYAVSSFTSRVRDLLCPLLTLKHPQLVVLLMDTVNYLLGAAMRARITTVILLVLLVAAAFAQAKDKDHIAEYKVGTFTGTGQVSDGSYANCSGGGCSAYSAAHNIHSVISTDDGVYAIEAPTSVAGTMLVGMVTGGNSPTIHKAWFMDNLHEGDKVLFAARCDMKHARHRCEFWLPDLSKPGKEIMRVGGFSPALAQTNTTSLCGKDKVSASVEAQVCGNADAAPQQAQQAQHDAAQQQADDNATAPTPEVQAQTAVVTPIPASAPARVPVVKPAVQQQASLCKSIMTNAKGNETCLDQQ
jgi:hypothetical protein